MPLTADLRTLEPESERRFPANPENIQRSQQPIETHAQIPD